MASKKRLKPIVGVLVGSMALKRIAASSNPNLEARLHLRAAAHVGVTAYYFSFEGVNLRKRRVRGLFRNKQGKLRWKRFPLANVVYLRRRVIGLNDRDLALFRQLTNEAQLINSFTGLNKWQTHLMLLGNADTAPMLPNMVYYEGFHTLQSMLVRHPSVYIKPDSGSGGAGIVRVWRDGAWQFGWHDSTGKHQVQYYTERRLREKMAKWAHGRELVVQQEIPVLRMDGRRCDVRVLMQKDREGQWQPFSYFRVSRLGNVVSNVHRGAVTTSLMDGLKQLGLSAERRKEIRNKLHAAALALVSWLEVSAGRMGEIGLDLAFDRDYNIWVIEANTRPGKSAKKKSDDTTVRFRRIMQYAKYLCQSKA